MGQLAIGLAFIAAGIALNLLFPPTLPDQQGFRLDDLSVSGSAYGKPINLAYGTVRLNGNIIWALDKIEVINTETVGANFLGKGGSTITNYTYFGTFAIAFAEGPADAILKIWANNKLIWDSTAPIGSDAALDNGKYPITFYTGNKTQLPDPDIESDKGVGNTPAYRGITYFVAKNWPLLDFGNGIPNITAEITFNGSSVNPVDFFDITTSVGTPGSALGSTGSDYYTINPFTGEAMGFADNGADTGVSYLNRDTDTSFEADVVDRFSEIGEGPATSSSFPTYQEDFVYTNWGNKTGPSRSSRKKINIRTGITETTWNDPEFTNNVDGPPCHLRVGNIDLGVSELDYAIFLHKNGGTAAFPNRAFLEDVDSSMIDIGELPISGNLMTDTTKTESPCMSDWFTTRHFYLCQTSTSFRLYEAKGQLVIDEFGSIKGNPILQQKGVDITKATVFPAGSFALEGFCFLPNEDALIISNGTSMCKFTYDDFSIVLTRSDLGFSSKFNWTLTNKFAFPNGDKDHNAVDAGFYVIDTDDLTTTEFVAKISPLSVSKHLSKVGAYDSASHSLIISQGLGLSLPVLDELNAEIFLQRDSGGGELLSDIVTDISLKAGFNNSEINVSDLTDTTVDGYIISRESTYRQMIEPLQRVYFFDGAESDWSVKFVDRGKTTVGTIAENDIGKLKQNDPKLIETRMNDIELPSEVIMGYIDKNRDKEKNTSSARRISQPIRSQYSDSDLEFEVSIVMDSTLADQTTEKSLYTLWAERIQLASELPWTYLKFDPTDNLTMVFNGESRRVRLDKFDIGADLSIEFNATQENADSHNSTLTGFGGDGFLTQTLPGIGTVMFLPIDSPLQLDADASLLQFSRSYYAFGELNSSAILYRSLDSGQSYDTVDGNNIEATWGFLNGAMPAPGNTTTWDESSTITVIPLDQSSRLVSSTDLAVLNGANALAIEHSDGGVEIVQYVNVTDNGDGTFTLSRLLRGRRGTEDLAIAGNTKPSPRFVYLNEGVRTFSTSIGNIGVALPYRAVPTGKFLTDVIVDNEAYTGQDLIPYSVAQIENSIVSGDKVVDWVRRTRHSGQLNPFTGTVPLNEESELYDVEYADIIDPTVPLITRTDLISPTDTITLAEWQTNFNDGQAGNQITFSNWGFQDNPPGDLVGQDSSWTESGHVQTDFDIVTSHFSLSGPPTGGGTQFLSQVGPVGSGLGGIARTQKVISLSDAGYNTEFLDSGLTLGYDVYMGQPRDAGDTMEFVVECLNAAMGVLSTQTTGTQTMSVGTWTNFTGSAAMPFLTRYVRITFEVIDASVTEDFGYGAIDLIKLTLGPDEVREVMATIYQKSSVVVRGRATQVRI